MMVLEILSKVFLQVLNMSITASWVILAVVFLRFPLRKAPRAIICFLWLLVAIRLICPVSLESSFSLIPDSVHITSEVVPPTKYIAESRDFDMENVAVPSTTVSANSMPNIKIVLSILWIIGMAALLCYSLVSFLRLHKLVSMTLQYEDNIYLCDTIPSPFILGVLFPKIYLPSGMTETQILYALAHEQAHLSRKDHLWKPLAYLLLMIHWFNPLCWIGYMLLCRDIEYACDEKVIRSLAFEEKKSYSQALLDCSISRNTIAACPLAFGEVDVKARVKSVLYYKEPSFLIIGAAVTACTITAVCFMTNPLHVDIPAYTPAYVPIQNQEIRAAAKNQIENFAAENDQTIAAPKKIEWVWPTISKDISFPYGEFINHSTGESIFCDHIDIRGEEGDNVYAATDGQVVEVAVDIEHGQYIFLLSDDGVKIMYGHLDEVSVTAGSQVSAGDKIGTIGKTGQATSYCLLFAVFSADGTVDPMMYYE